MIPVNVVFSPDWWNRRFGISFEEPFYLDLETRIANDLLMRRALFELFGIGEPDPQPRPVIGSRHIAGGFAVPALLGVPIRFTPGQAAWPMPLNLDRAAVMELRAPEVAKTWPMSLLLEQMDALEARFSYLLGDLNTGGLVNNATELRGNDFLIDLKEDPEAACHLLDIVSDVVAQVATILRRRTGTTSVAVNRSVLSANPAIHVTSNCSVSMISPALYQARVLPWEIRLAERLAPYGIHHCGGNLQKYAESYNRIDLKFLDVGFGSDVAACGRLFPSAFLNLRMSPVRMLECSEDQVYRDVRQALAACARSNNVGVCCINMDGATPDANVRAMFQAAADWSREASPGQPTVPFSESR